MIAVQDLVEDDNVGGLDLARQLHEVALVVGYSIVVAEFPSALLGLRQIRGLQFDADCRRGPCGQKAMVQPPGAAADLKHAASLDPPCLQGVEQQLLRGIQTNPLN